VSFRQTFLLAFALAALLAPAASAGGPPEDTSGVDQYVEDIPTSEGSKPVGSDGNGSAPLPPPVSRSLADEGGSDAAALQALATQSGLGAPDQNLAGRTAEDPGGGDVTLADALSGGIGALTGTDGRGSAGGLLLALLVLTCVIVAFAARRSRRRRI
jgi:hypothetical protein